MAAQRPELCCPAARAFLLHSRITRQARLNCISARQPGQHQRVVRQRKFLATRGFLGVGRLVRPCEEGNDSLAGFREDPANRQRDILAELQV